jgi:hypothetical protein
MSDLKTIVCFAKSRKTSGHCVAGKEWHELGAGKWVRPVSGRPSHEVSGEELRYKDGSDPQLLDIIKVPCTRHYPVSHQYENYVIDTNYYWSKEGRLAWGDIQAWVDHPPNLWGVGEGSYTSLNNRVAVGQEDGASLYLVDVERLQIIVGLKAPHYSSKRSVQGEFAYRGSIYRLDVTDPIIERNYLAQADGHYEIMQAVLCVSLSDPHQATGATQSYFYKLIAAVLYRKRFL